MSDIVDMEISSSASFVNVILEGKTRVHPRTMTQFVISCAEGGIVNDDVQEKGTKTTTKTKTKPF